MKYLKTFERIWSKNIIEGDIYEVQSVILANVGYTTNIPLGKVISKNDYYVDILTYTKNNLSEYILHGINKSFIIKKASAEQIQEFEAIEQSKKYNL